MTSLPGASRGGERQERKPKMSSQEPTSKYFFLAPAMAVVLLSLGGAVASCQDASRCSALRDKTYSDKRIWEGCDPALGNAQCIKIGGQPTDCTGVLACAFAVNRNFRDVAEKSVIDIVADDAVCEYACSKPTCIEGEVAVCEATSRRCLLVSSTLANGDPVVTDSGTSTTLDTSFPTVPVDADTSATDN